MSRIGVGMSDEDFVEEVLQLRTELQEVDSISLEAVDNRQARLYGYALLGNIAIEGIMISDCKGQLDSVEDANLFIRFIKKSANLKVFGMDDIKVESIALKLLEAVTFNPNIEKVHIRRLPEVILFEIIQSLLLQSKSLKFLRMNGNSVKWTRAVDLTEAFCSNKTLKVLMLESWSFTEDENPFSILADAIGLSESIKRIELEKCYFDASSTKALMKLVCRDQSNIEALCICLDCVFEVYERENGGELFLSLIESKSSTAKLNEIRWDCFHPYEITYELLLPFYQDETIECIDLHHVNPLCAFMTGHCLPPLRGLKVLRLNFLSGTPDLFDHLVRNLRKNFCICKLVVYSLFNPSSELPLKEQNEVDLLCKRNKTIQEWKKFPHEMHMKHLNLILASCLEYNFRVEIMFGILMQQWSRVTSSNVVSLLRRSKRRKTATLFYLNESMFSS